MTEVAASAARVEAPTPVVSVLLPTYNRAAFLGEAIVSILAQTYREFELIVIDDGSTDATEHILAAVADPRVRVLRCRHAGCSTALNTGLAAARGRYLARNDSDDVWLPDLLATLVPLLEARPEAGFVYARAVGMHADGTPSGGTRAGPLRNPTDGVASLLYADYTCSITTVFRRALVMAVGGYDPAVNFSEDWDLVLRVARLGPPVFVDRVVACYREHPGNSTALNSPRLAERLRGRRRVLDKQFADPDLPAAARRLRPVAYRNLYIGEALQWVVIGAHREGWRSLALAFRHGGNPFATLGRAGWSAAMWFGVRRSPAVARLVEAAVRLSRTLRRPQATPVD